MEFTDKDYHGVISQTLKTDNNAGLANVLISPIVQDKGPLRYKKSYVFLVALAITMSLASLLFAGNAITLFLKHSKSNTAINYLGGAVGLFILVICAFIVLHSMDGEYYTEDSIWHVHNYSDEYVKRKYPLLKDDKLFKNVKNLGHLIDVLRFAYIVHQEQEADALLKTSKNPLKPLKIISEMEDIQYLPKNNCLLLAVTWHLYNNGLNFDKLFSQLGDISLSDLTAYLRDHNIPNNSDQIDLYCLDL